MRVSGSVLCSQALEHAEDIFFFLLQAGYLLFKFKDPCVFVLVIRLTIGDRKISTCPGSFLNSLWCIGRTAAVLPAGLNPLACSLIDLSDDPAAGTGLLFFLVPV